VPETGRRRGTVGVVVVGAGREVVEAAVEVEEAGATVPVPTVLESAVPLPHDARRTLAATTTVTIIPCLIGSHGFTNTPTSSEHPPTMTPVRRADWSGRPN
jgi:hypothetical protein